MKMKLEFFGAAVIVLLAAMSAYGAHNTTDDSDFSGSLMDMVGEEGVPSLITMAEDNDLDDVDIKIEAITRLGELGAEDAFPVLIETMGFGSTTVIREGNTIVTVYKVRVASALALARVCEANPDSEQAEEAVETLTYHAYYDDEVTVQRAAVQALGMIPEVAHTEEVLEYLHDILNRTSDNGLASDICRTLGEIGDSASFVPLLRVTQGGLLTYVKEQAQEAIEKIQWDQESVLVDD